MPPTRTGPLSIRYSEQTIQLAEQYGWPVWTASPATSYEQLVIKMGFPGPPAHSEMYKMLKERPLREIRKAIGRKFALVTGIRRAESKRRSKAPIRQKKDGMHWINPIISWEVQDVWEYIHAHELTVIGTQDCQCGAFAHPGERLEVISSSSEQAIWLRKLEEMVTMAQLMQLWEVEIGVRDPNTVIAEHRCVWGHGNGTSDDTPLEGDALALCSTCEGMLDQYGNAGVDPDAELVALAEGISFRPDVGIAISTAHIRSLL